MSVSWNPEAGVDRTANGGYTVLPENVVLMKELSGRSEETDVTELAEDIKNRKEGQLVPAIAYKSSEGWPVLIAGHRRLRAIVLLNKSLPDDSKVRLKFNYSQVRNLEEALDVTVAENRNRTDVNPLDDAYNIAVYSVKFGKGIEEIAKKYFPGAESPERLARAVAWVQDREKLLQLSPEAQEELRRGFMSTSAALQLAAIPSKAIQNEVIKEAKAKGDKKLKVEDAKAAKNTAKGKPETKHDIKDSAPVKLLKKFKMFGEVASSLATEVMAKRFGRTADPQVMKELCDQILVMSSKLGVVQEASADKWAKANLNLSTVIDNLK